jgi:RHS repeat-associated protein
MGSVIGLMDENGQLVESFEYDAFGNVRSGGGEALPVFNWGGDSRFQGMWKDAGTGLYYVRARYYDPRTGRFLSRDPAEGQLEQPESFMPYAFANGNPYVFRDPGGENATLAEISAIVVVAAVLASTAYEGGQTALRRLSSGRLDAGAAATAVVDSGVSLGETLRRYELLLVLQIAVAITMVDASVVQPIWVVLSKKRSEREGDDTRGLSYDEIRKKLAERGLAKPAIDKLIETVEKLRGDRNKQKRKK